MTVHDLNQTCVIYLPSNLQYRSIENSVSTMFRRTSEWSMCVCMYAYHEFATELVSDVSTSIWLCDYSSASLTGQNSASLTDKILSSWISRHTLRSCLTFVPIEDIFEIFHRRVHLSLPNFLEIGNRLQIGKIYITFKKTMLCFEIEINSTELRFSISTSNRFYDDSIYFSTHFPIYRRSYRICRRRNITWLKPAFNLLRERKKFLLRSHRRFANGFSNLLGILWIMHIPPYCVTTIMACTHYCSLPRPIKSGFTLMIRALSWQGPCHVCQPRWATFYFVSTRVYRQKSTPPVVRDASVAIVCRSHVCFNYTDALWSIFYR